MATFLDIGLLENFSIIFIFILVWAVVFAVLQFTKMLGDNKFLHAIIGLIIGLMALLSPTALSMIKLLVPWFTVLVFFLILMLMLFKTMGAKDEDVHSVLQNMPGLSWTIIIIGIILLLAAFGYTQGQNLLTGAQRGTLVDAGTGTSATGLSASDLQGSTATNDAITNTYRTLFHPKVLGFMLLMIVSLFTIIFLCIGPPAKLTEHKDH